MHLRLLFSSELRDHHALRVALYQFGVKGTQLYVSSPRWRVRRSRSTDKIYYSQGILKGCEIFIKGDSKPINICNYFYSSVMIGFGDVM